jgi:G:T-mismatch repair DNA endonuclease (very short patch repair protein)
VPQKQPKRGRLWLNDSSCVRLRPTHPNHVWSYDFVEDRTHDGRKFQSPSPGFARHARLGLPRFRLALFVHGFFWHRHLVCPLKSGPP